MGDQTAWIIAGLVVALMTAGCIGATGGSDDGELDAAAANQTDAPQGQASATAPETIPLEEAGLLTTRAWVCPFTPVALPCVGSQPEAGDNVFEVPVTGATEEVSFEVSWEPSSPSTEELRFGVSLRCDEDSCDEFEIAKGASPLEIHLEDEDVGETSYIWVQPVTRTPPPVYTLVAYDQPFTLDGTIQVAR